MSSIIEKTTQGCTQLGFSSPLLATATLIELKERLERLARGAHPQPVVLISPHPRIFLAGADLSEIATLCASSSADYARLGRAALATLTHHPSPTVAAVRGSCSGGGFDLVMACDAIVAAPEARFAHPGVARGLVTGWGGTAVLPLRVGRSTSRRAMIEAKTFTAEELFGIGTVIEIDHDVERCAHDLALRLEALHPNRLALWRSVRTGGRETISRAIRARGIIG